VAGLATLRETKEKGDPASAWWRPGCSAPWPLQREDVEEFGRTLEALAQWQSHHGSGSRGLVGSVAAARACRGGAATGQGLPAHSSSHPHRGCPVGSRLARPRAPEGGRGLLPGLCRSLRHLPRSLGHLPRSPHDGRRLERSANRRGRSPHLHHAPGRPARHQSVRRHPGGSHRRPAGFGQGPARTPAGSRDPESRPRTPVRFRPVLRRRTRNRLGPVEEDRDGPRGLPRVLVRGSGQRPGSPRRGDDAEGLPPSSSSSLPAIPPPGSCASSSCWDPGPSPARPWP
jgi:hypothetical protein